MASAASSSSLSRRGSSGLRRSGSSNTSNGIDDDELLQNMELFSMAPILIDGQDQYVFVFVPEGTIESDVKEAKVYITDGHHVYCGDLDASKKPDSLRKETPQQFMTNVTETLSQTDFTEDDDPAKQFMYTWQKGHEFLIKKRIGTGWLRYCCLAMKQHARSASCIMQLFELSARRAVQFQQQGELSAANARACEDAARAAQDQMKLTVDAKDNQVEELVGNFVEVLNTKKARIAQLADKVTFLADQITRLQDQLNAARAKAGRGGGGASAGAGAGAGAASSVQDNDAASVSSNAAADDGSDSEDEDAAVHAKRRTARRRKQNKQRLSSSSSVTQSTFASPSIPPPSQTTQSQIADDGPVQGHVRGRYHRGTSEPTTLTQASTEEFDGANAGPSQATNAMGPGSVATSVHDSEIPSFNSIASKEAGFDVLDEAPKASKPRKRAAKRGRVRAAASVRSAPSSASAAQLKRQRRVGPGSAARAAASGGRGATESTTSETLVDGTTQGSSLSTSLGSTSLETGDGRSSRRSSRRGRSFLSQQRSTASSRSTRSSASDLLDGTSGTGRTFEGLE